MNKIEQELEKMYYFIDHCPIVLIIIFITSLIRVFKELDTSYYKYSDDIFLTNAFNNITHEQYIANRKEEVEKRYI
jgi:hypothetical protein